MKTLQQRRLGILGGGQLGKMFLQNALSWDIPLCVLDADADAPCKVCTADFTVGDLMDYEAVYAFGSRCDLLTVEIERVNTQALADLVTQKGVQVYPQPHILALIQDKAQQKAFFAREGFASAPYIVLEDKTALLAAMQKQPKGVQKLRRDGYDGRGVQLLRSIEEAAEKGFAAPSILEETVDIAQEIAVMVARNPQGEVRSYPPVVSIFHPEANLVEYLLSPAPLTEAQSQTLRQTAEDIITRLGMVGILGVEFFMTKEGDFLVNEVAPRPHNSGHASIEANSTSQFEQHLRAVMGLPLGDTAATFPAAMINLLGEEGQIGDVYYKGLEIIAAMARTYVHLYGKRQTRPFRKMGHITILGEDIEELREKALYIRQTLRVQAQNAE